MRFSPRFLKVFLRLPAPSFFSFSGRPASAAASLFAMSDHFLLGDRALARALAGAGVGLGALAAHRQCAAVPQPAVAADLHQPLDVHRDLLAEIALDTTLVLDHLADLA